MTDIAPSYGLNGIKRGILGERSCGQVGKARSTTFWRPSMKTKQEGSQKVSFDHDTEQKRTVGNLMAKNDFDRIEKINPFTQMDSNPCQGKRKGRR